MQDYWHNFIHAETTEPNGNIFCEIMNNLRVVYERYK